MAILKRDNVFKSYYCSECRMCQQEMRPQCEFCGEVFSNFEEVILEKYEEEKEIEIKK